MSRGAWEQAWTEGEAYALEDARYGDRGPVLLLIEEGELNDAGHDLDCECPECLPEARR